MLLPVLHSICVKFKLYKEIFECYTKSCEVYPVGDEEVPEKIRGQTSSTPERWTSNSGHSGTRRVSGQRGGGGDTIGERKCEEAAFAEEN